MLNSAYEIQGKLKGEQLYFYDKDLSLKDRVYSLYPVFHYEATLIHLKNSSLWFCADYAQKLNYIPKRERSEDQYSDFKIKWFSVGLKLEFD